MSFTPGGTLFTATPTRQAWERAAPSPAPAKEMTDKQAVKAGRGAAQEMTDSKAAAQSRSFAAVHLMINDKIDLLG